MNGATLKSLLTLSGCVLQLGARKEYDDGHYSLSVIARVLGISYPLVVRTTGDPTTTGHFTFEVVPQPDRPVLDLAPRDAIKLVRHLHGDTNHAPVLDLVPVSHIAEGAYFRAYEQSYLRITHNSAVLSNLDLTVWPVWAVCIEGLEPGTLLPFKAGDMVLPGAHLRE